MKKPKKRVCVIGLGQFGWELAVNFSKVAEILAIDNDQNMINRIADRVHRAIVMDARDFTNLSSVIGPDFDEAVVAMSENMEVSILAVLHLKKIGVGRIHAKAQNHDHASILEAVGADSIIFPERDTARRLVHQVLNPDLLDYVPISEDYSVMQINSPPEFHGRTLQELNLRRNLGVFVIAMRDPESDNTIFLPGPDSVVQEKMVLVVIGRPEDVNAIPDRAKQDSEDDASMDYSRIEDNSGQK
ncbi:MAG: potassium channel family protein [Verrucomicrobiota bacterium]